MNNPRSKSKQIMSMGMFILSSALIIVSVLITYYEKGTMNWVLLFAAVAINGFGIARTVRLYREKKADENSGEDR
ncbi:MAG: hypothetical protein ACM3UR_04850 [Bacteroidota bacterium]|jgi:heme O synthase-like polyprenyltransferase|nr:hypothetical protein [Ignavibacteria bacterium]MCU7499247.1 hypothetical protein [Ignavibacteria bacterium]MCU7512287.1 hypothetical protein [Ignavibacteria bacterium]MCU7520314.1 hypothetical protein [Ignavibacteria bacterium]MCU7523918.1 hypothetical protein [Ignavibacteria bacterium]